MYSTTETNVKSLSVCLCVSMRNPEQVRNVRTSFLLNFSGQ